MTARRIRSVVVGGMLLLSATIHSASAASTTSPESLVRAPYTLEQRVDADLDGDGDKDVILVGAQGFIDKDTTAEGNEGERVLVIASKEGRSYREIGRGTKALNCRTCGGAFWGVIPAPVDIRVEKRVLILDQESGSREVVVRTHRYRVEKGRVRLIGLDTGLRDRATGGTVVESENYLTGAREVTIDGEVETTLKPGRTKGRPKRIFLENVVFE